MYKCHHILVPSAFDNFFVINMSVHDHLTRQQGHLHVPLTRSTLLSKTIRFTEVKCYNFFDKRISMNVSYDSYRYNLRNFIRENGINDVL